MKDNEIVKSLEKIYSVSEDIHSIYTPLDLCDEMISSITKLEGDILVISNLEFLITLKRKGIDMNTVHYTVNCDYKKRVAVQLGLDLNNIYQLDYNSKEIDLGIEDMKFDVIIQNPPYNPNSLWKKFVLKGIDQLKYDGQMVVIHPDSWRTSSKHKKLFDHLKEHISELHIKGYKVFDNAEISVDWYVYNKQQINETKIYYPDTLETYKITDDIPLVSKSTTEYSILKKITKDNYHNGIIMQGPTGYHPLYKMHDPINGKYKQCGTKGNGTSWTKGDFSLTVEPTEHQFENKVVIAYAGKPRAQYFSKEDEIGVVRANYWLTDNKSLPILLNSKMMWKLLLIFSGEKDHYKGLQSPSIKLLRSLNFDGLNVKTEEELYEHYGLTEEEIAWIES